MRTYDSAVGTTAAGATIRVLQGPDDRWEVVVEAVDGAYLVLKTAVRRGAAIRWARAYVTAR